ncbi:MAG TPA: hypothetical protein VHF25_13230 [Nitriliruptorales bacterium]|nr:hypothetical protein [Nitriliruptorales bacterium]
MDDLDAGGAQALGGVVRLDPGLHRPDPVGDRGQVDQRVDGR